MCYGVRTNSTSLLASAVDITGSYQSCKIVRNGDTFDFYQDTTHLGEYSSYWFDDYSDYVLGLVAWGTAVINVKNIKLKVWEDD